MAKPKLTFRSVESSNIKSIFWRRGKKRGLFVVFHEDGYTKRIYYYRGVPYQRAVAMARANSVGSYFNRRIKNEFRYRRIA